MIDPTHKRIAGMHVTETGDIAVVWMALDTDSDHAHIYDACVFSYGEPLPVIVDSILNRGRWIPLAWTHEEIAEKLREKGVKTLHDKTSDSDEMAEVVSRDIWDRANSRRISYEKRLQNWANELKTLDRSKGKIPKDSHPLMAATRMALQNLKRAKRSQPKHLRRKSTRVVAII